MKTIKKVVRKVSRLDITDKVGLSIGVLLILPSCIMVVVDVITNGARMI